MHDSHLLWYFHYLLERPQRQYREIVIALYLLANNFFHFLDRKHILFLLYPILPESPQSIQSPNLYTPPYCRQSLFSSLLPLSVASQPSPLSRSLPAATAFRCCLQKHFPASAPAEICSVSDLCNSDFFSTYFYLLFCFFVF